MPKLRLKIKGKLLHWKDGEAKKLLHQYLPPRPPGVPRKQFGLAGTYILAEAARNGEGLPFVSAEEYDRLKSAWENLNFLEQLKVLNKVFTQFYTYEWGSLSAILEEKLVNILNNEPMLNTFLQRKTTNEP